MEVSLSFFIAYWPRVVKLLTRGLEMWFPLEIKAEWPQEISTSKLQSPVSAHTAVAPISFISETGTLRFSPIHPEILCRDSWMLSTLHSTFFNLHTYSPYKVFRFIFPVDPTTGYVYLLNECLARTNPWKRHQLFERTDLPQVVNFRLLTVSFTG